MWARLLTRDVLFVGTGMAGFWVEILFLGGRPFVLAACLAWAGLRFTLPIDGRRDRDPS